MQHQSGWGHGEGNLSFLLVALSAAAVAYFPLNPGTAWSDVGEIVVPLGVVLGLLVLVFWFRFRDRGGSEATQVGYFGWLGALVSGVAGCGWVAFQLHRNLSVDSVSDEALTILSVGVATGVLIGGYASGIVQRHSGTEGGECVLAEATWTNSPHSNPVLVAVAEQLAEIEKCSPCELEPLSDHVDPDVFARLTDGAGSPWQLQVVTDQYEIQVNSYGTVTVYGDPEQVVERATDASLTQ